ncbi:MAG: hypothetical protein ACRD3B_18460 [Candidatus Sulfotelmatobacter sp.]
MKSSRITVSVAFGLFVLLTPAFAQTNAFKVTVPFQFAAGKQTLPAGEYMVKVNSPAVLQLSRLDGPGIAIIMTSSTGGGPNQDPRPRLVFHSYGDHHFLAQVWINDVNIGHELSASGAELESARAGGQQKTTLLAQAPKK